METGLYFSVKVGDLPSNTFDVVEFNLDEALFELFTLMLKLSSKDSNIDLQQQLLQKVTFTIYANGEKQRTVNGIVESAVHGDIGFKRTFYTIVCRPLLWQLTLTKDSRIYHFKSVPDIIDEILQDFSIVFDKQLMDAHEVREYTTLKRESYYDFIRRLASEEGISFWFEEDKLFYSDSRLGMTAGPELIYNSHPQAATKEPTISQLTFGAYMRPTEAKLKDYRYSHPSVAMDTQSKADKELSTFSIYDSYGRYDDDQKTGQQFAKYRLEALQANSEQGQANSNYAQLMPGKIFQISEHPSESINNSWQIVKITHCGTLPQSLDNESDDSSASLTNHFTFIPGKNDWRPEFIHKPLADGDEIATVVGPAGEEIYVNEDGAVKVHFHWNKFDAADENASCWVRVVQNWNGDGFGFLATPRIGQEVIISYLNGDIDRPIITGTVYNGSNRPPVKLPQNKTQMSIRSKTHKGEGFNELRFEDENGKQQVFIHAQKDMDTKVLNDRSTRVMNNHKETIDGNQTITVKKHKVETVTLTSNELTGGAKTLSVGAAYSTTVVGAMNTAVGLSQTEEVGLRKEVFVGDTTEIISGKKIELRCGKSLIRMHSDGLVEIKGLQVSIDEYSSIADGRYKKQFVLAADDGEPIAYQKYKVMSPATGLVIQGITNEKGEAQLVCTEDPDELIFELVTDQHAVGEGDHRIQFIFKCEDDDTPIANQKYKMTSQSTGEEFYGVTDEEGKTQIICTQTPQEFVFEPIIEEQGA